MEFETGVTARKERPGCSGTRIKLAERQSGSKELLAHRSRAGFPYQNAALREADQAGVARSHQLQGPSAGPIRFDALAEFYLKTDYGEDAGRPKSENSIPIVEHYVRDYLIARWGKEIAENIKTSKCSVG